MSAQIRDALLLALSHYRRISSRDVREHCEGISFLPEKDALVFLSYQLAHLTRAVQELAEASGDTDTKFSTAEELPVGH